MLELSKQQITEFTDLGYLLLQDHLTAEMVGCLLEHCEADANVEPQRRIVEADGSPYSVYLDQDDNYLTQFKRYSKMLDVAKCLLNGDVYVHQIKMNHKVAFTGSNIAWHRDLIYWKKLDHLPGSNILTAAILLDDVNEFNSPLLVIPKSHKQAAEFSEEYIGEEDQTGITKSWKNGQGVNGELLISDLRYIENHEALKAMVDENGLISFTGNKGSVIFFHGDTLHASNQNISPWDRKMLFITYNSVDNVDTSNLSLRERYISYPDNTPLSPLDDSHSLLQRKGM